MLLKVKDGNVYSINEAGNRRLTYYTGGDAVRSYWSEVNEGWVDVYLKNGDILLVNRNGNIMRRL
jgi:hypothetical protein